MSLAELAGTLAGALAAASLAAAAFVGFRRRGTLEQAREAAEAWRVERDAAVARAERLELELRDAQARITALEARVEELSRRPDLRAIEAMIDRHEERAEQRMGLIVGALERVVGSLEKENA